MSAVLTNENSGVEPALLEKAHDEIAEAFTHATIRSAQFGRMVRSKLNVRRKGSDLAELAALIRAQGLLQNLVGFPQLVEGVPTGVIEIVAGGRRLGAIGLLIAQGELPDDYQIPYLCVTEDEAVDLSLAENLGREDMHPADVFDAMLALSARGRSIEDIALNFHLDVLTVRRRLKLANISPKLLDLYRNDEANFDQMMALAISDDHAAQEQAWESLNKHYRSAHELRRLLTAQSISVQTDRVARFVGVAAFEKAGGVVTKDLFSNSGGGFISDGPLLERLAMEKLEKERRKLSKEGHAWIDVLPRADQALMSEYPSARMVAGTASEAQSAELTTIRDRVSLLQLEIDGLCDDDERAHELAAEIAQLNAQCRAIERSILPVVLAEDRALSGALVSLDESGTVIIRRRLIRPGDKAKMVKLPEDSSSTGVRHKGVHSDRLTRLLTSHRTLGLQAEMIQRPDIALVVVTHALMGAALLRPSNEISRCARVTMTAPVLAEETTNSPAAVAMSARRDELKAKFAAIESGQAMLEWLLARNQEEVLAILAYCIANSLDAVQDREGTSTGFSALADALKLDMSKWWRPTADNYFHHVSKERTLAVVAEAVKREAAVPLEKMKKGAAAEAAERALAGAVWLPEPLRLQRVG